MTKALPPRQTFKEFLAEEKYYAEMKGKPCDRVFGGITEEMWEKMKTTIFPKFLARGERKLTFEAPKPFRNPYEHYYGLAWHSNPGFSHKIMIGDIIDFPKAPEPRRKVHTRMPDCEFKWKKMRGGAGTTWAVIPCRDCITNHQNWVEKHFEGNPPKLKEIDE